MRWTEEQLASHLRRRGVPGIAAKVDEGHLFRSETSIDEAVGRTPRIIKSITKKNKLKSLFEGQRASPVWLVAAMANE
jgi:hypothetical protein